MRQTGQIKGVKDGVVVNYEHKTTFIFTKKDGTKVNRDTNDTGAFDFDVPNGEYSVSAFVTNTKEKQTYPFRSGLMFVVNAQTSINALNIWISGGDIESSDPLQDWWVAQFAEAKKNADDAKEAQQAMTENGYVKTKDATLAYLFGNPANGLYKTQDNDPNFIGLTPLGKTNAYVKVHNYYSLNSSYVSLEWTYVGAENGRKKYEIVKTNNEWRSADEIYKGNASIGLIFSYGNASQITGKYKDANNYIEQGIYHFSTIAAGQAVANLPFPTAGILKVYGNNVDCAQEFSVYGDNRFYKRKYYAYSKRWTEWALEYSTSNTTVDTNGFIKKASPIIKLFDDHIEWNQDFKEDPIFEKIAPGTYKISNTYGLAREGWTYEKPRGKDGNFYFKIKVQKLDDGCIVSVHDYFIDYEDVTIIDDVGNKRTVKKQIEVLSQARDIKPEERWIDLRFFEKIYDLTNEPPIINVPYHPLWGIDPYVPLVVEQIEEDIALLDQRAF